MVDDEGACRVLDELVYPIRRSGLCWVLVIRVLVLVPYRHLIAALSLRLHVSLPVIASIEIIPRTIHTKNTR